jgi:hypothetical protein
MNKNGRFQPQKQKISTIPVTEDSTLLSFLINTLKDQSRFHRPFEERPPVLLCICAD